MRASKSLSRKGFESIITTMLFIGVMIGLFLAINYLNATMTTMRAKASDDANMHVVSQLARDKLRNCYGEHMEELSNPCQVLGINGYEIIQHDYGSCPKETKKADGKRDSKTTFVSFNPIDNPLINRTCLGKIIIYI